MNAPITRQIAEFLTWISYDDLSARSVSLARLGFIDCVAVMIAGQGESAVRVASDLINAAPGRSRLFLSGQRTSADRAALLNGTAAHVLDYDDVALDGHPSVVLVPAILALADEVDSDGRRMTAAYVAGYELWAALLERQPAFLYNKGWHPTCVLGAPAAAAACAVLLGLDATRAAHAVSISASMAAGVRANFGTMTKSLQVGRAAQSGVLSARLAAAGFTGAEDAFEHPGGWLNAFSPKEHYDIETPMKLGHGWRLERYGLNIKKYPICYCAHRAVDAILDLLKERPIAPEEVERIEVQLGYTAFDILRNHGAHTGLEAKFSIEFAIASALHAGRVGLDELTDEFVQRPEVQATMAKVDRYGLPDDPEGDLPFSKFDKVLLHLRNGEVLESEEVAHARGSHVLPLTDAELWSKFESCVRDRPAGEVRALFSQLLHLDSVDGMAGFGTKGGALTSTPQ